MPPYPDCNVGNDGDVSKQNQNAEYRLLESSNVAQIDSVQTCVGHGTCTEKDGVYVAESEKCFGIATIAIDTAAVHYDRWEDYGQDEVDDVHTVEIHFEPAMSLQVGGYGVDVFHVGGWGGQAISKEEQLHKSRTDRVWRTCWLWRWW